MHNQFFPCVFAIGSSHIAHLSRSFLTQLRVKLVKGIGVGYICSFGLFKADLHLVGTKPFFYVPKCKLQLTVRLLSFYWLCVGVCLHDKSCIFFAALKQLYELYFLPVYPSARPDVCPTVRFWLCSHHRITIKFSGVIKGQGQRSKVKVRGQGHIGQNPT